MGLAYAIVAVPAAAAVACLLLPSRAGRLITVAAAVVSAALILIFADAVGEGSTRADALTALFLLPVALVYGMTGLYTHWYVRAEPVGHNGDEAYRREFLALTNAFACAEAIVPLLTNLGGLWIALEATTVIAALLVRLHGSDDALEAAWKYILIASCGLAIGLAGVVVLYASATAVLGVHHNPQWSAYLHAAKELNPDGVRLAFIFALIGFGTKMGLAPMHTWLPDAHGAGPTPTSAMLSGILLSDALYVILRFTAIANAAIGNGLTCNMFFIVGFLSLVLGAFVLLRQTDVKRMLAYSSIEHVGIIACGIAFGAPFALAGALLHVVTHSAAKALAFLSAGRLANRYGTRDLSRIRGAISALPLSGTFFALSGLALAGMPPFGTFRSELMILAGGFGSRKWYLAPVVAALLVVAFAGIVRWSTGACAGEKPAEVRAGEGDFFALGAMSAGLAVIVALGLFMPLPLQSLLDQAARIVEGT